MSLRSRLSVLVGVALLPPIGLLAYDTVDTRIWEQQQLHQQTLHQAELVAGQIEEILHSAGALSLALAARASTIGADVDRCTELMRSVATDLVIFAGGAITDHTGTIKCGWPNADPVSLRDRDYVARAMAASDLVIGTVVPREPVSGFRILPAARRYMAPNSGTNVGGVIVLGLNLDRLSQSFEQRYDWRKRNLLVLDRRGNVVINIPRSRSAEERGAAPVLARARDQSGSFESDDVFGHKAIVGYARAQELLVAVGHDQRAVIAQINASTWRNILVMAMVMLLAIGGAWFAGERLVRRPVKAMVESARRYERGERHARFPELRQRTELGELSSALNHMAEANERLLAQREILMRELQHRVMNSLQLLASLLQLQARNADPASREQLAVAHERIISMSTIFRHLYRAELGTTVEFGAFLESFCQDAARTYLGEGTPRLEIEADRREIPLEHALSLSLITHELITNALKHAFPPDRPGCIRIAYRVRPDGGSELSVADNGKGMPEDVEISRSKSLGMLLVQRLTQSLNGELRICSAGEGTEIKIELPPSRAPA